jgi:hypothetical protein
MNSHGLKHSLSAILSIIASSAEGISYIFNAQENHKIDT